MKNSNKEFLSNKNKKILSCFLAFLMLLTVFMQNPTIATAKDTAVYDENIDVDLVSHSFDGYKTYTDADMTFRFEVGTKYLGDGSKCTSMQGLCATTDMLYVAKINSANNRCAFVQINAKTGAQTSMNYYSSLSASSPSACNTAGHANDITVKSVSENGGSNNYMYVATMESPKAITRMKIQGNGLYFTGCFDTVNTDGKSLGFSAIKWAYTSGDYHYFLLKTGDWFYVCKILQTASGGPVNNPQKVTCYKLFYIDRKNAVFATSNSTKLTIPETDSWTNQGFGYDHINKIIYVPIFNKTNGKQNAIVTYNMSSLLTSDTFNTTTNKSYRISPTKLSFLFERSDCSLFEVESCAFRLGQNSSGDLKLYFNVNADNGKEGIYSFNCNRDNDPHQPILGSGSVVSTIRYDGNGATSGSMATTAHIKGISSILRANAYSKDGFSFAGWYVHRKSDGKWLYQKVDGGLEWFVPGSEPHGAYKSLLMDKYSKEEYTDVNNDTITCYAQWNQTTSDNTLEGYSPIDLGNNFFAHIRQSKTGLYITDTNYSLFASNGTFDVSQIWNFSRCSDGSYIISNSSSGYVWDVASGLFIDGRGVGMYQPNGSDAQRFFIYYIEGNFYFRCATAYKTLDVDGGSKNLQLYGCGTGLSVKDTDPITYNARSFEIVKYTLDNHSNCNRGFGTNYIAKIQNVSSGKFLTAVGDQLIFKNATNKNDQLWFITQNSDGSHCIRSLLDGKAIDVKSRGFDAGTELWLYDYNGTVAQTFYFHDVSQTISIIKPTYTNCVFDMDAATSVPHLYPNGSDKIQVDAQQFSIADISQVSSLLVSSMPDKTLYNIGETLDLNGLKISAVAKNGITFDAFEYSVSQTGELTTVGTQTITVNFAGVSTSFDVNIVDPNSDIPTPPSEELTEIIIKEDSIYHSENKYIYGVGTEVTVSDLLLNFENNNLIVYDSEGNLLKEDSFVGTGSRISLMKNETEIDNLKVIVMGDVDGNGKIDTTDYLRIKMYFLESFDVTDAFYLSGDVDSNGIIESTDYMRIKLMFLQK